MDYFLSISQFPKLSLILKSLIFSFLFSSGLSQPYCNPLICVPCTSGSCDSDRFLQCIGSFCECGDYTREVFIPETQTCYLKPEIPCTTVTGSQKCVPNSNCFRSSGLETCICDEPLIPSYLGQYCRLPYNSSCDISNDFCDEQAGLECSRTHTCLCVNADHTKYDESSGSCLVLHDGPCDGPTGPSICTPKATCSLRMKCQCDIPYKPNRNRECALPFRADCDLTNDMCNSDSHLECLPSTGLCDCKQLPRSFFDINLHNCYLLIGSPCVQRPSINSSRPEEDLQCHPDAVCDPITDRCKCRDNMVPSADNTRCVLKYSDVCNPVIDRCDKEKSLKCLIDPHTQSYLCSCADPVDNWWDPSSQQCKSLVDAACSVDSDCQSGQCSGSNMCHCVPPSTSNKHRICYLPYMESCSIPTTTSTTPGTSTTISPLPSTDTICDPEAFLACDLSSGTCLCKDESKMKYEHESLACAWAPNSPCTANVTNPSSGTGLMLLFIKHSIPDVDSIIIIA